MSRIIIYVDHVEADLLKSEPRYSFSGDFILAGRDQKIASNARKIDLLLQLLLEQMGSNPVIEFRRRA